MLPVSRTEHVLSWAIRRPSVITLPILYEKHEETKGASLSAYLSSIFMMHKRMSP